MKLNAGLLILFCFIKSIAIAQSDTTINVAFPSIFERISKEAKEYKLDTTTAPNDKITRKIIELRKVKGGFNINEAIDFKLEEDKQKKEISDEQYAKLSQFFKAGNGKQWLNNSVIWIYRQHFNYKELKQLVRFYKTSAGQKLAEDFPIVMIKSFAAAEMIKNIYAKNNQLNKP